MASKPYHPATVHWPIAFLSLAYSIDLLHVGITKMNLPILQDFKSAVPEMARASHYLQGLGLLMGLVSASTGVAQAMKIYQNGGLYEADGKTLRPKMKTTLMHAAANDVVLLASGFSWYVRRANPGYLPRNVNLCISAVMLPTLLWSAAMGGTLTYNHGAGLNIVGKDKSS